MDVTIEYPIIFRVDRIETIKITSGTFTIDPRGYDEAGFKKRTPFMYSGELQTIRFEFAGVLEALLDRLPNSPHRKRNRERCNSQSRSLW